MELLLETVALYSLKLAYETEGHSPILRDDPLMGGVIGRFLGCWCGGGIWLGFRAKSVDAWIWRWGRLVGSILCWAESCIVWLRISALCRRWTTFTLRSSRLTVT